MHHVSVITVSDGNCLWPVWQIFFLFVYVSPFLEIYELLNSIFAKNVLENVLFFVDVYVLRKPDGRDFYLSNT